MSRSTAGESEPEPYRLSQSPSHMLHRAEQLATDRFANLVDCALTLRQFAVLSAIADHPGLSQNDLVRATGVDRSTLTDMIRRLETRGLITKANSSADKRAHSVALAPPGAQLLAAATPHARAADAAILDALPRAKRRTFLTILTKLSKFADTTPAAETKPSGKKKKEREANPKKARR
ncbi:MAG: MarR family transcriptional regulator [Hyphomonadaceae bacterium]|nr:MarR family transcriptional regulator [Hyphomonadaceae bacterium]